MIISERNVVIIKDSTLIDKATVLAKFLTGGNYDEYIKDCLKEQN